MNIELNGEWDLILQDGTRIKAQVPGCNYLDLYRAGVIPDPFFSMNEKECYWVSEADWLYEKKFELTEDILLFDEIKLCAQMLDTVFEIFMNGISAAKGSNCHINYHFDVKEHLRVGENVIAIKFFSPVEYVRRMQDADCCPVNWNGQRGINHLRKPQYHFGWDWGPALPPSGIGGDIRLEMGQTVFCDWKTNQLHTGKTVTICNSVMAASEVTSYRISLVHPNGETSERTGQSSGGFEIEFIVDQPKLWYTRDLREGNQPLYELKLELFKDGKLVKTVCKRIGLKKLELLRKKEGDGESFRFILNGIPLFIKGANYIPHDSFMTQEKKFGMKELILAAEFAQFNMLRIWGGGYYGSEEFYDLCDEKGILVWQDFMFACQPYPFYNEEFLNSVEEEVRQNVLRLRDRACLALWCGNNETEAGSNHWIHIDRFREATEDFFWRRLPAQVRELDSDTPYIPGSPVGSACFEGWEKDDIGDTHLWEVWHGLKPMQYNCRKVGFCSEFGFESFPDFKTVKAYTSKVPELYSQEILEHQKCKGGNQRMVFYMAERLKYPKFFEDFVYLSQINQAEFVRMSTEYWRRHRGLCNGSLYWQFNDCWPGCSWSGIDYFGRYKALQYAARRFNAPVALSGEKVEGGVTLYIVNDIDKDLTGQLSVKIFDFYGKKSSCEAAYEVCAAKLSVTEVYVKTNLDVARYGVHACFNAEGNIVTQNTMVFCEDKKLKLPESTLKISSKILRNTLSIKITVDYYARYVCVQSLSDKPFSDNFFDLLPGQEILITQNDGGIDHEALLQSVKATSLSHVERAGSRLYDYIKVKKVRRELKKYPI